MPDFKSIKLMRKDRVRKRIDLFLILLENMIQNKSRLRNPGSFMASLHSLLNLALT